MSKNAEITLLLKKLEKCKDSSAVTVTFECFDNKWGEFKNYGLYEAHQFAIKKIDTKAGFVTIANPHDASGNKSSSTVDIRMPLEEFLKYVRRIDYITF